MRYLCYQACGSAWRVGRCPWRTLWGDRRLSLRRPFLWEENPRSENENWGSEREGEIMKEKTSCDTFRNWADLYWSKMEGTLLTRMPFKNWFLDNHVPFIQNDKKLCGDVSLRKLCTIPMLSFIIFDPILLIILLLI